MCSAAVQESGWALKYIPNRLKTKNLCPPTLNTKEDTHFNNSFGDFVKPNAAGIDAKLKAMQQPKTAEKPAQTAAKTVAKPKAVGIGM